MTVSNLTIDHARTLHAADLESIYRDVPIARDQLQLRRRGTGIVRAALRALGHEYSGSGGWHITAYATDRSKLGFINLAHGVAVETDVQLDTAMVEALTIPEQGEGPKASGAAAWTTPDAGEGRRASAPPGWVQLLVDVRVSASGGKDVSLERVSARVVCWGLRTCYTSYPNNEPELGHPGYVDLGCDSKRRLPIAEWPMVNADVRREMRAIGAKWLDSVARKLAVLAGCADGVSAALDGLPRADMEGAIKATDAYGVRRYAYDAATAADSCCGIPTTTVVRDALRECGVARISAGCDVSDVGGLMYYDLIGYLLQRAIVQRLTPVAEVLWSQMAPLVPSREDGWDIYMRIQPVLTGLATEFATDLLRGVHDEARATEDAIVAAYYVNAPVSVDIRIEELV